MSLEEIALQVCSPMKKVICESDFIQYSWWILIWKIGQNKMYTFYKLWLISVSLWLNSIHEEASDRCAHWSPNCCQHHIRYVSCAVFMLDLKWCIIHVIGLNTSCILLDCWQRILLPFLHTSHVLSVRMTHFSSRGFAYKSTYAFLM